MRLFSLTGDITADTRPLERSFANVSRTLERIADRMDALSSNLGRTANRGASDLGRLNRAINGVANGVRAATTGTRGLYAALSLAAGVAGGVALIKKAVVSASDLNETLSKVGVVFGDSTDIVVAGANDMAKRFGIVKGEFLDAGASLGLIAKAAGLTQEKSARLSDQLARLAVDASSFYNVPLAEALAAMRSGLVGESEPLRQFGVLLNEAAVDNEALALGLARSKKEIDEGSKVQARASLIIKGLADATGDLERTQSGFANRVRMIGGQISNMITSVGSRILPIFVSLGTAISDLLSQIDAALERNEGVIQAWAEKVADAVSIINLIWKEMPIFVQIAQLKIGEKMLQLGEIISRVFTAIWRAGQNAWGELANKAQTMLVYLKNLFMGFAKYLSSLFATIGANLAYHLQGAILGLFDGPMGELLKRIPGVQGLLGGIRAARPLRAPEIKGDMRGLEDDALGRGMPDAFVPERLIDLPQAEQRAMRPGQRPRDPVIGDLIADLPNLGVEIGALINRLHQINAGDALGKWLENLRKAAQIVPRGPVTPVERLNADNRRRGIVPPPPPTRHADGRPFTDAELHERSRRLTDAQAQRNAARVLADRARKDRVDAAHPVGRAGNPELAFRDARILRIQAGERAARNQEMVDQDRRDRQALVGLSGKQLRDKIAEQRLQRKQNQVAGSNPGDVRRGMIGVFGKLGVVAGNALERATKKLGLGDKAAALAGLAGQLAVGGVPAVVAARRRVRPRQPIAPVIPQPQAAFQSQFIGLAEYARQISTDALSRDKTGKDEQIGLLENIANTLGGNGGIGGSVRSLLQDIRDRPARPALAVGPA